MSKEPERGSSGDTFKGIPIPIIGGVVFTVFSTILGMATRDQELGSALLSGISSGVVFALAWMLIIRMRRGR